MRALRVWAMAVLAVAGCVEQSDTGSLGTFVVTATLTGNGCGAQSVPAPSTFTFDAQLAVDRGLLTWRPVGGARAVGSYDTQTGAFRVAQDAEFVVRAEDRRFGIPACVLRRLDVLDGRLDLGALDAGTDAAATDAAADATNAQDAADDAAPASDGGRPEFPRMNFQGVETILYGATAGSECSGLVGASDGQFTALPCEIRYTLRGVAR